MVLFFEGACTTCVRVCVCQACRPGVSLLPQATVAAVSGCSAK